MIIKKKIRITGLVLLSIAVMFSIFYDKPDTPEAKNDKLEAYIEIQAKAIEYREELCQNSAFERYFSNETAF